MISRKVLFQNQSSRNGRVVLFQKAPENLIGHSLVWVSKYCAEHYKVFFEWKEQYCFVLNEVPSAVEPIYAAASLVISASPGQQITLTHRNGGFEFINCKPFAKADQLSIIQNQTIPKFAAHVGIGMSGNATFVVEAEPNVTTSFKLLPEYWIAFGNFQTGDLIDSTLTNCYKVDFKNFNNSQLMVTLAGDNTWITNTFT